MSQQETSVINLKESLGLDLNIPEYQRPYTWTEKNVVQLLDDVIKFSRNILNIELEQLFYIKMTNSILLMDNNALLQACLFLDF